MEFDSQHQYLLQKQAFYHGHTGAGKTELLMLALCLPLFITVGEDIKLRLPSLCGNKCGRHYSIVFLLELVVVVLPQVGLFMGALPPALTCTALLLLAASSWAMHATSLIINQNHRQQQKQQQHGYDQRQHSLEALNERAANMSGANRRWVTCFRGGLMLYTVISILAVDFRAFPRRYAKSETYGTGLMDMGVGAMMVAGGMVSRSAKPSHASRSLLQDLASGVRAAAPCWVLWVARLVSLRAVDYHEHVGEYGVHWNFFASVAVVTLLSHAVLVPTRFLPVLAAAVTCSHQVVLSFCGLGAWGLSETRDMGSLLDMNKEGLVSVMGYWALHLWGATFATAIAASMQGPLQQLECNLGLGSTPPSCVTEARGTQGGRSVCGGASDCNETGQTTGDTDRSGVHDSAKGRQQGGAQHRGGCSSIENSNGPAKEFVSGEGGVDERGLEGQRAFQLSIRVGTALQPLLLCILGWAAADALLWMFLPLAETYVDPVSRRLCNLAFIVWVCAFCGALLIPLLLTQALLPSGLRPCLPAAINHNMLPLFIVANLFTGLVNLSTDTLSVSDQAARAVVSAYASLVCGLAAFLHTRGIKIGVRKQQ